MSDPAPLPSDHAARERFRVEWRRNFAVSANAGSGKTTAISERLAAMALDPLAAPELRRTAVVTYTLKAAEEIGARARERLLRRLEERGPGADLAPLEHLERTFFGTLHSFCLKLAREHGQEAGLDLAPEVLDARAADAAWEDFLAGDPLELAALPPEATRWLFRLVRLEDVLDQARELEPATAARLLADAPRDLPPAPSEPGLSEILALPEKGPGAANLRKTKTRAADWFARASAGSADHAYLGIFKPDGTAKAVVAATDAWMRDLSSWAARAAGAVAGEIAGRFAAWRRAAGVQTFADQVSAARDLLRHPATLAAVRAAGWRVLLDEAQDTDETQFAILVELTRPPDADVGGWPGAGAPPLPGRFCMVGDGQQSIYSSRASVRTFQRYLAAFDGGEAGDRLAFEVTFRAPRASVELLNATLPATFSAEREPTLGRPPADGAPPPFLQVPYQPLVAGPRNAAGRVARLPLDPIQGGDSRDVNGLFATEMRQVAAWLRTRGPAGLGLSGWGELCILVARNKWMDAAVEALEAAGLKAARQSKQQLVGDLPAYAWVAALTTVCCEPDDDYEWFGVLRELFALSDDLLAREKLRRGRFEWESPESHAAPLAAALETLRPSVQAVDDEGAQLDLWFDALVAAAGLEARAHAADPGGANVRELARLRADARAAAAEGLPIRDWAARLVAGRDAARAETRGESDAITVQTCHSAKGLEWPAVLVPGLWREIAFDSGRGLQVLRDADHTPVVYLQSGDIPADTKISRERERRRELVRLLYVALTRPRQTLLLPWGEAMPKTHDQSFAALWGHDLNTLPAFADETAPDAAVAPPAPPQVPRVILAPPAADAFADLPAPTRRILPHQLAEHAAEDGIRSARHETGDESLAPPRPGEDPIAYGLWWHETVEFIPWLAADAEIEAYVAGRFPAADALGAGERARREWSLLRTGPAWRELRHPRWRRLAELSVLAPLAEDRWMDGVMDLVLHDAEGDEAWVLDWKTNRRRTDEPVEVFLARLAAEYAPQLRAYGRSLAAMFPTCRVRRLVYATGAGAWTEILDPA
jgi:ATP-dependent exoDNAse (exonuclease V) beta subunit